MDRASEGGEREPRCWEGALRVLRPRDLGGKWSRASRIGTLGRVMKSASRGIG